MKGFEECRQQAQEAGIAGRLRVYYCDGWDEASQEIQGAAVLMGSTDDPREAIDIGVMEVGHHYRKYGEGQIIVLDEAGRRVDPYRMVAVGAAPALVDGPDGIDLGKVEFVDDPA